MNDKQIRERCAAVGLRWLPPDDDPDGFPGSFDMVSMAEMRALLSTPVDVVLHCPKCHTQHIDKPSGIWKNPPHRTHLCEACGCLWRPADVPTNGVAAAQTRGQCDSWPLKETK